MTQEISINDVLSSIKNVIKGDDENKSNILVLKPNNDKNLDSTISQKTKEESANALQDIITLANQTTHKPSKTVEELVAEVMKPHIIKWLNENLSFLVKELVSKEIKNLLSSNNEKNI